MAFTPELTLQKARAFEDQGKPAKAIALYRKLVGADPAHVEAHAALAGLYLSSGEAKKALPHAERASVLDPSHFPNWHNRGAIEQTLGLHMECEMSFRKALSLEPDHPETLTSFAMAALRNGYIKEGFAAFEKRFETLRYQGERTFNAPRWQGEDLKGGTLLIHSDQGLGDTIQFVRFAARARKLAGRVVLGCQPPLLSLMESVEGVDEVLRTGDPMPELAAHCPLPSLPYALGLATEHDLGMTAPYVKAPVSDALAALEGLEAGKTKVGLVWAGNPDHPNDRYRSIDPRFFKGLATREDLQLVSLQLGAEASAQCARYGFLDMSDHLTSMAATARLIQKLDLVISVDTSIAHLAAALGRPVHVILPKNNDWRWMSGRTDSPWYPSATLYRQEKLGEWKPVIDQLQKLLEFQVATQK